MWIIAVGKAAVAMASGARDVLGGSVRGGVVIAPAISTDIAPLEAFASDHPVPTVRSERAAARALALAASRRDHDLLLVLLSGGASALMAAPASGLTLEDKGRATNLLLRAGADIHALNTVRKHLSRIKGGWLAARASAPVRALVISDVVGDDPTVIGSGPTVADPTTFADALHVVDRFGGRDRFPASIRERLERGQRGEEEETPKPGDPRLERASWQLIGSRFEAMAGAAAEARRRGYDVQVQSAPLVGEAHLAGRAYVERLRALGMPSQPLCLISSGETTVHVTGTGRGGRNQELAASVAEGLPRLGPGVVFASCGTDGIDGPTDAAGAIADSTTVERAATLGLSAAAARQASDTYHFFEPLGDLIKTGSTGTNVGDLQICLIEGAPASP